MIRPRRIACWLLAVGLIAGCSGIKTYPDTPVKNLLIRTEAASGSAFSSMRVALHIHSVDANCRTEYQGTVQLGGSSVEIGIPPEQPSYLVFTFFGSSFLGSSRSSISYDTLLRPRAGFRYDVKASYKNNIYNVEIQEADPRRSRSRAIVRRSLDECGRGG